MKKEIKQDRWMEVDFKKWKRRKKGRQGLDNRARKVKKEREGEILG